FPSHYFLPVKNNSQRDKQENYRRKAQQNQA
ncbi:MAG: hypothetical protein ACJA2G_001864, partial [Cognaticolwellia sp.]